MSFIHEPIKICFFDIPLAEIIRQTGPLPSRLDIEAEELSPGLAGVPLAVALGGGLGLAAAAGPQHKVEVVGGVDGVVHVGLRWDYQF